MSKPSNIVEYKSGLLVRFASFREDDKDWMTCTQCDESVERAEVTVVDDVDLGHAPLCPRCLKDTSRICDSCGDWSTTTKHVAARDTHYEYGTGIDEGPDLCAACNGDY